MSDSDNPQQKVSANNVLTAIHETQRLGHRHIIEDLEHREPDLAEHLLEGLSRVHHDLLGSGLDARKTRKLYRSLEELALISIRALEIARQG